METSRSNGQEDKGNTNTGEQIGEGEGESKNEPLDEEAQEEEEQNTKKKPNKEEEELEGENVQSGLTIPEETERFDDWLREQTQSSPSSSTTTERNGDDYYTTIKDALQTNTVSATNSEGTAEAVATQTVKVNYRTVEINGSKMLVFESRDEDAPWMPATFVPGETDPENIPWSNDPNQRQVQFAAFEVHEFWSKAARDSVKMMVDQAKANNSNQTSWNVSARALIVELAYNADALVYTWLHKIAALDEDKRLRLARTKSNVSLFSKDLDVWLSEIKDDIPNVYEILGYDEGSAKRLLWIKIFHRLRNRFVHRSPYFLEYDFEEMRKLVQLPAGQSPATASENIVFTMFVAHIAQKLYDISRLSIGFWP